MEVFQTEKLELSLLLFFSKTRILLCAIFLFCMRGKRVNTYKKSDTARLYRFLILEDSSKNP